MLGERHGLGHFHVQHVVVAEDRIVGAHDPRLVQLLRMHVEKQRAARAERHGDLANHAAEATGAADFQRALEQHERVSQRGHAAAHERFVREQLTVASCRRWVGRPRSDRPGETSRSIAVCEARRGPGAGIACGASDKRFERGTGRGGAYEVKVSCSLVRGARKRISNYRPL